MISTTKPPLILASFASMVSRSNSRQPYGHRAGLPVIFPRHTHARQATLHTAHDSGHRIAGSYQARTQWLPMQWGCPLSHSKWSPRKPGRMLHAIGARPGSLTPSTHPKLGVKSRHQGLHRYALHRIFRPYLEKGGFD